MTVEESQCRSLFAGEGILVLQQTAGRRFRVIGVPPPWVAELEPEEIVAGREVEPAGIFPFLDQFLDDARQVWDAETRPDLTSDIWSQTLGSGREMPFTATARRVGPDAFLLIRTLGVDYEEQRRLLQKARELSLAHERLLKEISKKEALLHCLVHDIEGPATAVSTCFSLIGKDPNLSDDMRELVVLGQSEATRQQVLLRGTLDLFATELSALDHFSSDVANAPDVLQCVRSVIKQLTATFIMKGVAWKLALAPEQKGSWKVVGHAERLERVLYNLLENALRYTPVGSTVTIRIAEEKDYIRVAVEDQGLGLEPGVADKLFERFRQGQRSPGKAGLGLFFCRIMVERWGGKIGCQPLAPGGAQFWFRLPKPQLQQRVSRAVHTRHQHILYVDDDWHLVLLTRRALERLGYQVDAFTRPTEALAAFKNAPDKYDLVVSDFSMPEMSGMDLLRCVMSLRPGCPVLLMSGYLGEKLRAEARATGVSGVVRKPSTVDELRNVIDHFLVEANQPEPDSRIEKMET
jgi:signal transduction histidine kinase/ActR/RegA family two-component response regulator